MSLNVQKQKYMDNFDHIVFGTEFVLILLQKLCQLHKPSKWQLEQVLGNDYEHQDYVLCGGMHREIA